MLLLFILLPALTKAPLVISSGGGGRWQQPLHTVKRFTLFLLNAHRQGCRAAVKESTFSRLMNDEKITQHPFGFRIQFIPFYTFISSKAYTLSVRPNILEEMYMFLSFLFLTKHQIKATWWKKRKEIPQRTKSNLPEHQQENRGASGSQTGFQFVAFLSKVCFHHFWCVIFSKCLIWLLQKRLQNKQRNVEVSGQCRRTMTSLCQTVVPVQPCRNTKIQKGKDPYWAAMKSIHLSVQHFWKALKPKKTGFKNLKIDRNILLIF